MLREKDKCIPEDKVLMFVVRDSKNPDDWTLNRMRYDDVGFIGDRNVFAPSNSREGSAPRPVILKSVWAKNYKTDDLPPLLRVRIGLIEMNSKGLRLDGNHFLQVWLRRGHYELYLKPKHLYFLLTKENQDHMKDVGSKAVGYDGVIKIMFYCIPVSMSEYKDLTGEDFK
jgi:hypothetical protein